MAISDWLQTHVSEVVQFAFVLLLGAGVGAGELVTRYKDAPGKAIKNLYGLCYVTLNATAAFLALVAIQAMDLNFGLDPLKRGDAISIMETLAAGLGAMSIFRSSAFVARVGEQDVPIGPSAFLSAILSATDREVDRRRAEQRADAVQAAMVGIDFQQSHQALPVLALALMQNLPEEDAKKLHQQLDSVRQNGGLSNSTKSLCLGLSLMNVVGEDVLAAAVSALKKSVEIGGDANHIQGKGGAFSSWVRRFKLDGPPSMATPLGPPPLSVAKSHGESTRSAGAPENGVHLTGPGSGPPSVLVRES
ncbi:hypothetical protein [Stigmatella erecta]|uniref:Uncharacterized protein n=1 Tax=Stigmatella erecta TaxID=83460 RepID=A0A1I0KVQ9_9BACT|nr:hypothetical protein [Stigmatella erecta]SEU29536.1 hypothetical protein SAMN05443639_114124 [Stigmatella erecta]